MKSKLPKMSKKEKLSLLADLEDGYYPFDQHALALLRSLLDDSDAQVRAEAIACLWDDPDPGWIDVLMRKASEDPHAQVRAHAISALGRYVFEGDLVSFEDETEDVPPIVTSEEYERVSQFLFRIAQNPEESLETRRYAIEALAFRADDPDVTDLIAWAYNYNDRRMKISALFAMTRHGDSRWTEYILKELNSGDQEIQYEAVHAAGEMGLREAVSILVEMIRNKSTRKPLRLLAIYALGQTGDTQAYPLLDQLTHTRDRDVRDVALEAMDEWFAINVAEDMIEDAIDEADIDADDNSPDIWNDSIGVFSKN